MKYSEAKSRIKDILESKYGDEWSDHYKIEEWESSFGLSKRDDVSELFKVVLWVSEEDPGYFEVRKLGRSEKPLAEIFMELALTPLEEREEEKKYMVKVWDLGDSSRILVEDRITGLLNILTTNDVDTLNLSYRVAFTKNEINYLKSKSALHIDWDKAVEEYNDKI